MEKKIVTNRTDSFAETCAAIISGVISVFLVFAVIAVPLIYDKSYFQYTGNKIQMFLHECAGDADRIFGSEYCDAGD